MKLNGSDRWNPKNILKKIKKSTQYKDINMMNIKYHPQKRRQKTSINQ